MGKKYILAIDQGTTSSRAVLFNTEENCITASKSRPLRQIYPRPGWVEHDAVQIKDDQIGVARDVVKDSGISPEEIAALGITNQRETVVLWDRKTGEPVHNAIVWQCRRTAGLCNRLKIDGFAPEIKARTGLVVDAYFSGTKIQWLLDNNPGLREKASAGQLMAGTIDSWLIYNLTGQTVHVTDYTNASRTMLFNINTLEWDKDLLKAMKIPEQILPEPVSSSGYIAKTDKNILGREIPICGIAGDQQAALFGQTCFTPGSAKNTYGTGCFILMNIGDKPKPSQNNLLNTIAWVIDKKVTYALEGSIFNTGSAIQWLRDEMGLINSSPEADIEAEKVPDTNGVYMVPAFTGLGAPHWDMYARGTILGLTRGSNKNHLIRAVLESIAFQSTDVLNAMNQDSGIPLKELKVDGGASVSDFLMQFQADIQNIKVIRPKITETTALGAVYLAGLGCGIWNSKEEIAENFMTSRIFVPAMPSPIRNKKYENWKKAVERSMKWDISGDQIMTEYRTQIAIIGGSTGGTAAAIAACSNGYNVILTEESEWIGGQLTSQMVPPDEHRWIEKFGCTATYRQFRNKVREYYRRNFTLSYEASRKQYFNPGNANVSKIAHDPRTALAVLNEMLAEHVYSSRLTILTRTRITGVDTDKDFVRAVTCENLLSGNKSIITADYFIDATDCGDMLPKAGAEYVTGAESQKQTGEPNALAKEPDPDEMQAVTYCLACDYVEGGDFTIEKPFEYDFWKNYKPDFWPDKYLGLSGVRPQTLEPVKYDLFPGEGGLSYWKDFSLFTYRRILDKTNFMPGTFDSDITIINWPQNDYFEGSVIDVPEDVRIRRLDRAKQLSLSLLYWLQTEAPNNGTGKGHPQFRLRPDVSGTSDGLAMAPYIRESRRIKAEFTVLEHHLTKEENPGPAAKVYPDSVGIGYYDIDLHPSTSGRSYIHFSVKPFTIPLGSLIPVRIKNLIPGCKNIGTTHITNGCYRLHPVEWNIGESAGHLVSFALKYDILPAQIRNSPGHLEDFQSHLISSGIELKWPF